MRIDLEFVELHTPLFLDGVNFGTKLKEHSGKGRLELWYETALKHTFVRFNGKIALIETTASKTVSNLDQLKDYVTKEVDKPGLFTKKSTSSAPTISAINTAQVKAQATGPERTIRTAQVSTPMDKVQGTPGGKKPKYQGEDNGSSA